MTDVGERCTVSCLSLLSPDNPGCYYRVLETAANFKRGGDILSILIDSPLPHTEHWYGAPGGPAL